MSVTTVVHLQGVNVVVMMCEVMQKLFNLFSTTTSMQQRASRLIGMGIHALQACIAGVIMAFLVDKILTLPAPWYLHKDSTRIFANNLAAFAMSGFLALVIAYLIGERLHQYHERWTIIHTDA